MPSPSCTIIKSMPSECDSVRSLSGHSNTRVYNVVASFSNAVADTELLFMANAALNPNYLFPMEGFAHPYDATKICTQVQASIVPSSNTIGGAGRNQFRVTAQYATKITGNEHLAPLSRPPVVRGRAANEQYYSDKDAEGTRFCNSAGDPLTSTPPLWRDQMIRIEVTYNTLDDPIVLASLYNKTTNDDTWNEQDRGTVLVDDVAFDQIIEDFQGTLYTYWSVTVSLVLSAAGFRIEVIDQGYTHKRTGGGENWTNVDPDGEPCPMPKLLNGTGCTSTSGVIQTVATPVIFPADGHDGGMPAGFSVYAVSNFDNMNLPSFSFDLDLNPPVVP